MKKLFFAFGQFIYNQIFLLYGSSGKQCAGIDIDSIQYILIAYKPEMQQEN